MISKWKKQVYLQLNIKKNGQYKFRTVVFVVSSFVGNPYFPVIVISFFSFCFSLIVKLQIYVGTHAFKWKIDVLEQKCEIY